MTAFRTLAALAATGFCFLALPAAAQTFSEGDRTKLEARIAQLDAIVSSGDFAGAMEVVPPVMFRTVAERAGATEAQLMAAMREMIRTQMIGVKIIDYTMELAAASPTLTPDGSRTYLMIPTTLVMEMPDATVVRVRSRTLALKDGTEWYLIRVQDGGQIALVRQLWPAFVGVEFPAGTTEALD